MQGSDSASTEWAANKPDDRLRRCMARESYRRRLRYATFSFSALGVPFQSRMVIDMIRMCDDFF